MQLDSLKRHRESVNTLYSGEKENFMNCMNCVSGKDLLPPSSAIRQHFSKLTQGEKAGVKFLWGFHIQNVSGPLWEHNQSSVSQRVFCH